MREPITVKDLGTTRFQLTQHYEAPVIATISKLVATRMGPPARTKQTKKVPAALGENQGKQVRFAGDEGLDIIRMYGILRSIQRDDTTGVRRGQQGGQEEEKGTN